jgi:phosphoenolpyruvate synthase/pyruvate phosphate dikinase
MAELLRSLMPGIICFCPAVRPKEVVVVLRKIKSKAFLYPTEQSGAESRALAGQI